MVGFEYGMEFRLGARTSDQYIMPQAVPFLQQKKALVLQVAQIDCPLMGQRMVLGNSKVKGLTQQFATHDVRISAEWQDGDCDIELAGLQAVHQRRSNVLNQLQVQFGKTLEKFRDSRSYQVRHDRGDHAHAETSAHASLQIGQ